MKLSIHIIAGIFLALNLFGDEASLKLEGYFHYEKGLSNGADDAGEVYVYLRNNGAESIRVVTLLDFVLSERFPSLILYREKKWAIDKTPLEVPESILGVVLLEPKEMTRLAQFPLSLSQYHGAESLHVRYVVGPDIGTDHNVFSGKLEIEIPISKSMEAEKGAERAKAPNVEDRIP